MKNRRFFQKLIAVLLLAALACPIGVNAMAVEEWESTKTTYRYAGYTYDAWTILYKDNDGRYRSSSWIQEQNNSPLPAKYIGVSAEIRNTSGKILISRPVKYNAAAESWIWQETSSARGEGTIYSTGKAYLSNGSQSVEYDLPRSANVSTGRWAAAFQALAEETLTAEGTYPVNAKGQTYGSAALSKVVGYEPDLLAAVGIDGVDGYILRTDVRPELNTFEEICAYEKAMDARTDCTIPLFDAEGNEIGRFQYGEKVETSDDVKRTLDWLEQEKQKYMEQVREDIRERRDVVEVLQNGVDGYCRRKDMDPSWGLSFEQLSEYVEVQDTITYFAAPIYDGDGNKIGMFDMSGPSTPSPETQRIIDRLTAEQAAVLNQEERKITDLQALAEKALTAKGIYPVNAKGQTYGPAALSELVGYEPDLLAAVGIGGVDGYILRTDVHPELNTFEEICAYEEAMAARTDCTIPLFDAEGNEIGRFQYGEKLEPSEDVRRTIDRLEQEKQAARAR
ncbi:hypothetical protein D1641_07785 [Colidextribacter sp. OB.20]|uniref:hypothetical protein n=1 Tax=Colidextribacter sp. OB.20 TaxID=2304568 RepID=UPI00136A6406|nr:hypothetical protein [Colidextribacter sp. OB.20]NBI09917.1 hypothetical protein [Colidextribacter sp. OB.20]